MISWIRWLAVPAGSWLLASQVHSDPLTDRVVHTGARASGQVSVFKTGAVYSLRFIGDETIEYQINLADPVVAHGVLRVYEKSSDSYPIYVGGPGFRFSAVGEGTPDYLANWSTLTGESMTASSVILDYTDNVDGVHHRRHEFTLAGKSLRIRVRDLDDNLSYGQNYCGLLVGRMEGVDNPKYIPMQGALATPLVSFNNGAQTFFVANMLDMYVSNASDWSLYQEPAPGAGATSVAFNVHTFNLYKPASNGLLSKSLDETLNVTVSRFIKDVLVMPTQPPSPYRSLLTGRTVLNLVGASWPQYLSSWNLHRAWGMDQLAGYVWASWPTSAIDGTVGYDFSLGPDWYPAKDALDFTTMIQQGVSSGMLLGAYMAFNLLPPTAPLAVYDPSHCARNPNGTAKLDVSFTGFPLLAATASAIHANREANLVKSNYGNNLAYVDVQTYGPPANAPDGDHIDQVTPSPWAHSLGQAIADQKAWFAEMQEALEGPLLGEGSIATPASNFEWLWAGYCDSVQRVINSGGGLKAQSYPAGSPLAPTNWPVIPEFELRVMSRLQANHGNGFPDRFFGKSDGSSMVRMSDGAAILPMTEAALDRYRLYEITYGKTSYLQSNGPYNGIGNYEYFADMIKEYYMMTALQERYYDGVPRIIKYLHQGVWKTFEEVLSQTGTTASFRDAQIRVRFSNGLEMFLNHNPAPLVVVLGDVTYTIPEDGFVARDQEDFLAFSAITPATGGQRIDYCFAPLQYEFFDGRGQVNGYGGINTRGLKRLWLKNFVYNRTVWELDAHEIRTVQNGPEPLVARIDVIPTRPSLDVGERMSLKAMATYSNGASRNVTTLVQWSSSNSSIARVNNGAACTAVTPGQVTISVSSLQGAPVVPASIQVN